MWVFARGPHRRWLWATQLRVFSRLSVFGHLGAHSRGHFCACVCVRAHAFVQLTALSPRSFIYSSTDSVPSPHPSGTCELPGKEVEWPAGLSPSRGGPQSKMGMGDGCSVAHPASAPRAARAGCLAGADGPLGPGLRQGRAATARRPGALLSALPPGLTERPGL